MKLEEIITKLEKEMADQKQQLKKPYTTGWGEGYIEGCIETISSLLKDLKKLKIKGAKFV